MSRHRTITISRSRAVTLAVAGACAVAVASGAAGNAASAGTAAHPADTASTLRLTLAAYQQSTAQRSVQARPAQPPAPTATQSTGIPSTGTQSTGIPSTGIPSTGIPSTGAPTPTPSPTKPASPGSPQKIAQGLLGSYGWPASQFSCLNSLWEHESRWSVGASNAGSGAYGIPQALPGSRMASAGPDWQTNATTQIKWGLQYIKSTYASPCAAWSHEQATGYY